MRPITEEEEKIPRNRQSKELAPVNRRANPNLPTLARGFLEPALSSFTSFNFERTHRNGRETDRLSECRCDEPEMTRKMHPDCKLAKCPYCYSSRLKKILNSLNERAATMETFECSKMSANPLEPDCSNHYFPFNNFAQVRFYSMTTAMLRTMLPLYQDGQGIANCCKGKRRNILFNIKFSEYYCFKCANCVLYRCLHCNVILDSSVEKCSSPPLS